uniref:DDE-1 domain-containing protein n=1 Tax=Plectus sambesii TaxID=2011161 RepID=A0A914WYX7_9BILA
MITKAVKVYLNLEQLQTWFANNRLGKGWLKLFLKRHREPLSVCKAEELVLNRAHGVNSKTIDEQYHRLEVKLIKLGIYNELSNIHNCDETRLLLESGHRKIVSWIGIPKPLLLAGINEKEMVMVLFAVSDADNCAPPFFLYKARLRSMLTESWTLGGPAGAGYSTLSSGWMDEENFYQWLLQIFIPWAKSLNNKPHLLILDGHSSDVLMRIKHLSDDSMHLFTLSPHLPHPAAIRPCVLWSNEGSKTEGLQGTLTIDTTYPHSFVAHDEHVTRMVQLNAGQPLKRRDPKYVKLDKNIARAKTRFQAREAIELISEAPNMTDITLRHLHYVSCLFGYANWNNANAIDANLNESFHDAAYIDADLVVESEAEEQAILNLAQISLFDAAPSLPTGQQQPKCPALVHTFLPSCTHRQAVQSVMPPPQLADALIPPIKNTYNQECATPRH